ncbi:hypothetical protein D3C77_766460 [compost metagenome]
MIAVDWLSNKVVFSIIANFIEGMLKYLVHINKTLGQLSRFRNLDSRMISCLTSLCF